MYYSLKVDTRRYVCYNMYKEYNLKTEKIYNMKNIIIAGTRTFSNYILLEETLDKYIQNKENITIISGTAKGADKLGEKYASEHNIPVIYCPADWKRYRQGAGIKRNEEMASRS